MNDSERLEFVLRAAEELVTSYCDVIQELSQYRAVDREEQLAEDIKEIIGI